MRNLSPASQDLGLGDGDALRAQLDDDEEERRKKLLGMANPKPNQYGDSTVGLASMTLFGGIGGARG